MSGLLDDILNRYRQPAPPQQQAPATPIDTEVTRTTAWLTIETGESLPEVMGRAISVPSMPLERWPATLQ